MGKPNRPFPVQEDDESVHESAFRKAAARLASPEAEPSDVPFDVRDSVFAGTMPRPTVPIPEGAVTQNRRPTKRKGSPFNVVMLLLLAAIASVLYISNVIAVGRLTAEIGSYEERLKEIQNAQELLRAEIARLSGLERIRGIAEKEYNMRYSDAVPGWITVTPDRAHELNALATTAGVVR